MGDCTSSLASGSTCQPTCDTGYTVSGTTSCNAGILTAATCAAATRSAASDCSSTQYCYDSVWPSSDVCHTCSDASYPCTNANSLDDDCTNCISPCDASSAPTNGGVGDCTSSLASGSTCQPTCDTGYTVSGTTSCNAGILTAATCAAATCSAASDCSSTQYCYDSVWPSSDVCHTCSDASYPCTNA